MENGVLMSSMMQFEEKKKKTQKKYWFWDHLINHIPSNSGGLSDSCYSTQPYLIDTHAFLLESLTMSATSPQPRIDPCLTTWLTVDWRHLFLLFYIGSLIISFPSSLSACKLTINLTRALGIFMHLPMSFQTGVGTNSNLTNCIWKIKVSPCEKRRETVS